MKMTSTDYLKKALLDSQEHVRDYMAFSRMFEDKKICDLFRRFAIVQGEFASEINQMLGDK